MAVTEMKTNEDKKVELTITVDAETFGKAVDEVFKKNVKRMTVPGFRRGKAPRRMIEKLYGEGVFYEEAVNNTYPAAYDAAVEEKGIEPVDRADIEVLDVSKDGYSFKATVTVKPEVSIEGYKGIEVEKKVVEATDAEVDAELSRMQEQGGRVIAVEGRAAMNGDTAVIDFEGFVDGEAFEGGKGEKYPLELGSNSFIPGFEEQIVGHSVGESFEVNVSFPENYHAEELKGKPAVFKCTLHELKMKELPLLDDEFAKDVSDYDTLDELKASIRKNMEEQADKQAEVAVENDLVDQVIASMQGEIPEVMYENRLDEMVNDYRYRLEQQGLKLEMYLQYLGQTVEQFRESFKEQAEKQVKIRLALEAVAAAEGIVVSDEEFEAEINRIAESYKMEADKVKALVSADEVKKDLAVNKAIDLIKSSASITTETKTQEASAE